MVPNVLYTTEYIFDYLTLVGAFFVDFKSYVRYRSVALLKGSDRMIVAAARICVQKSPGLESWRHPIALNR